MLSMLLRRSGLLARIVHRQGVDLSLAAQVRWSGAVSEVLESLYDLLRHYVLMPDKVRTDVTI